MSGEQTDWTSLSYDSGAAQKGRTNRTGDHFISESSLKCTTAHIKKKGVGGLLFGLRGQVTSGLYTPS